MASTKTLPPKDSAASDEEQKAIDAVNATGDADVGEGAGRSVEDLAAEQDDGTGQQFLDFGDTLNLTFKGKKPTDSELKIKSISREVKGQLGDKGDEEVYTFVVRGRVDKIELVSRRDGEGAITSKVRRATLTPVSFVRVSDEQLAALETVLE